MAGRVDDYLTQLLNVHWLRPETALWRSFDCLLAERYVSMAGRSIDLGCGDGTLSFIMAGGRIADYDAFRDIGELQAFNQGADIYNVKSSSNLNVDQSELRYRYDYGVDHKGGLIDKAAHLGDFYANTQVQDLNTSLPFEGGSFDSAFSNILYWLNDLDVVLTEWRRILSSKGKMVLFVPGETFKEKAWLYYSAPHQEGHRYLNFFDRGYASLIHHCYGQAKWCGLFEDNGFSVVHHENYLTDSVMELWNIGTRPIAPLLISMSSKLSSDDRASCKADWVEYFREFLKPVIEGELDSNPHEERCAFHFFVLEKN